MKVLLVLAVVAFVVCFGFALKSEGDTKFMSTLLAVATGGASVSLIQYEKLMTAEALSEAIFACTVVAVFCVGFFHKPWK